jgi:hypothetical protein
MPPYRNPPPTPTHFSIYGFTAVPRSYASLSDRRIPPKGRGHEQQRRNGVEHRTTPIRTGL